MGQSAGRARRHPDGKGSIARSTPRQRDGIDNPPGYPTEQLHVGEPEGREMRLLWVGAGIFLLLSAWIVALVVLGVTLAS